MPEIVGQDEVVDMPNDKVRIQTIMEERSTAQYSMMAIDQSTVIRIGENRKATFVIGSLPSAETMH